MNIQKQNLKLLVRGAYSLQDERIRMGNKIAANFKAKLGQKPSEKDESLEDDAKKILVELRKSHKKLTDGIKTFPKKSSFKGDPVISEYTELCLVDSYIEQEKLELQHFSRLKNVLKDFDIWNEFLKDVKGCGPAMAGVIISEIDIHKSEYPSSLWAYAGYDVAPDGKGRSRRKEHLIKVKYTNKDGELDEKNSITYNPRLKNKLWVLATCFIKAGGKYRQSYDDYKNRLEHHPNWIDKSKLHKHNAAVRYMIKRFLVDLYAKWRELERLPVAEEYSKAKLGIVHKKSI